MKYSIDKNTPPAMPNLGNGMETVALLLSQTSKNMREPLAPMIFPILGTHVSGAEFLYPDRTWKEPCGMMANIVADSGAGKGQLSGIVDAVCRDFRKHDEEELEKLVEWQKEMKTRAANKEKPARPDVAFWMPPADMTNAAFIQNAIGCEQLGARTQYINMPEVEMADQLCGGHRQVSQIMRNIYDRQRAGALRATIEGVTGNPVLRANLTISSTPFAARKFYRNDLSNGTFGRMVFSYKPRQGRDGRIPRQGRYDDSFYEKLDKQIYRLKTCRGRFIVGPLNRLIDQLAGDMAVLADVTDDDVLWDMSKRSLVSAWKAGCLLWILNDEIWTKPMTSFVEWLVWHDIWSKTQIFGDMLAKSAEDENRDGRRGPKNMLEDLPQTFSAAQLEALRQKIGKDKEGAKNQLYKWVFRKLITYSEETGMYTKVE